MCQLHVAGNGMYLIICTQLGLHRWSRLLRCQRSTSVSLGKCQFLSLPFCLLGELTAYSKRILPGLRSLSPAYTTQSQLHDFLTRRRLPWTQLSLQNLFLSWQTESWFSPTAPVCCTQCSDFTQCLTVWAVKVPLKLKTLLSPSSCLRIISLFMCLWL